MGTLSLPHPLPDLLDLGASSMSDTQLLPLLPTQLEEAMEILGCCMNAIMTWMKINKLKLNLKKNPEVLSSNKFSMQALNQCLNSL